MPPSRPPIKEARLDVVALLHDTAAPVIADVSWRHPCCEEYIQSAAKRPAVALEAAVRDKRRRYGTGTDGTTVTTCAIETWGLMCDDFINLLQVLALLAAQQQRMRGQPTSRWLRRWKLELSLLLARHIAAALDSCGLGRTASSSGTELGLGPVPD